MKLLNSYFTIFLILMALLFHTSCSGKKESNGSAYEKVFAGSTPGDSLIKAMLAIPAAITVDFIQWELKLNQPQEKRSTFLLNIVYGESQPGTPGFKKALKKAYEGEVTSTVNTIANNQSGIYHLKSPQFHQGISMVKINDHLVHLLTPQNQLMVGNGGYSYTLNYKGPLTERDSSLITYSAFDHEPSLQSIYEGRTPCQEFAEEHAMTVSSSCFKLKWKITLNRDPESHQPTTYIMRKVVDNSPRDIEGKWTFIKGTSAHPNAHIIQLNPDMPDKSILLLEADENILYFLHKDTCLFVGNEDFSYTLNRQIK